MSRQRLLIAMIVTCVLAGCASMSKEECVTADWYTVGVEDGARGLSADRIARHRRACAKAGVAPDHSAYENGRQAGLRDFCQPQRGYEYGHSGATYQGVCPQDLAQAFERAYADGRDLYLLEQAVRDVQANIARIDNQLDDLEKDLRHNESILIDNTGTREERTELVDENRELAEQVGELELEKEALLIELGERREQLRQYEAL